MTPRLEDRRQTHKQPCTVKQLPSVFCFLNVVTVSLRSLRCFQMRSRGTPWLACTHQGAQAGLSLWARILSMPHSVRLHKGCLCSLISTEKLINTKAKILEPRHQQLNLKCVASQWPQLHMAARETQGQNAPSCAHTVYTAVRSLSCASRDSLQQKVCQLVLVLLM